MISTVLCISCVCLRRNAHLSVPPPPKSKKDLELKRNWMFYLQPWVSHRLFKGFCIFVCVWVCARVRTMERDLGLWLSLSPPIHRHLSWRLRLLLFRDAGWMGLPPSPCYNPPTLKKQNKTPQHCVRAETGHLLLAFWLCTLPAPQWLPFKPSSLSTETRHPLSCLSSSPFIRRTLLLFLFILTFFIPLTLSLGIPYKVHKF